MARRDNDGYTPLHLAAREGHVDSFKEILKKGNISQSRMLKETMWSRSENGFYQIQSGTTLTCCENQNIVESIFSPQPKVVVCLQRHC